jgi:type II secretory pathway pseudopilin PulG
MKKWASGFTVVEVLAGIGLFALIAPAIILSVVSINGVNDRSADLTYANTIAENKIESLRSAGYNSMTLGTVVFTTELPATFREPRSAQYTISAPTTGQKKVVVTLTYTDQTGLRNLQYESIMSELGVSQ